jgi:hypothetical protein
MGIRDDQIRAVFTLDKKMWGELRKIRKRRHLANNAYSDYMNYSLSLLLKTLKSTDRMENMSETQQRIEAAKLIAGVMEDMASVSKTGS